ncbi:MAG: NAD(P)H-hydrate dehydratase [Myxococcales bacterium]|nr:MAG: NAD(P)H-hydrate dehydratase [Myxococcales bacterium]
MIPLFTAEQARAIDRHAVHGLGIPGILLMENAGVRAANCILESFADKLSSVLVVCGPGQNGGDGFVVARQLDALGISVNAILIGEKSSLTGDAKLNAEAWERSAGSLSLGLDELRDSLPTSTLVVDALFGTGLSRELAGDFRKAVELINQRGLPVVSMDVPSGIDSNTGQILGAAIQAALTVTFGVRKLGLYQFPGRGYAGDIRCESIGVPAPVASDNKLIEATDLPRWLHPRALNSHKGTAGHLLIIGGSKGKSGAALLAAKGAMHSGAGLVTIATDAHTQTVIDGRYPEFMSEALVFSEHSLTDQLTTLCQNKDALVIGPGMGLEQAKALGQDIYLSIPLPTVLDADALNFWQSGAERLSEAKAVRILTPHPAEAARLLRTHTERVQSNRIAAAKTLSERCGSTVVLKGACTVIAATDGRVRIVDGSFPAMATAGSGDVLSGIIAAQLNDNTDPFDAASAGVLLHLLGAKLAGTGDRGLLASQIAEAVPRVIERSLSTTV